MGKRTSILDDGFQAYLTEGAILVGDPGIPMLMDLHNAQIPRGMIPFKMASRCSNRRQFVHFYMFDREFSRVLTVFTRSNRHNSLSASASAVRWCYHAGLQYADWPVSLSAADQHLHESCRRLLSAEERCARHSKYSME